MKIQKIGTRNIVFTQTLPEWDLNLHLIMGRKYNYIIDTGLGSHNMIPIQEYLGDNPNPVIVINTHYHWDHIWGNHCFADSIILSHSLCRELILQKWDAMIEKNKRYIHGEARLCPPNMTFDDSIFFPDDNVKIFYTPGHTIDGISVFDAEDKVLNAGDNIGDTVDEIIPSIETQKDVYLSSIQKYKSLDVTACVSGHNIILGKEVFEMIEKNITR